MFKEIVLSKQDYYLLSSIKEKENGFSEFCSNELEKELRTAMVINSEELPDDIVRIGSVVKIVELEEGNPFTIKLVRPSKADIKENKISIQAPLGVALIGYRKGDTVSWMMPGGIKRFRIIKVIND